MTKTCEHCALYGGDVRTFTMTFWDERFGHVYELRRDLCAWHLKTYLESPLFGEPVPLEEPV